MDNVFYYLLKYRKIKIILLALGFIFLFIFMSFLRFKMIGSNRLINAYPSLSPLYGLVFGPLYGLAIFLLVNLVKYIINPKAYYFGLFSFVPPILSVITAGFLSKGNKKIPTIIYILGFILFFLSPIGKKVPYFIILDFLAFLLVLEVGDKITKLIFSNDLKKCLLGSLILSFSSVMVDHLYGSILGVYLLNIPSTDYKLAIPEYILERTTMSLLGSIFIVLTVEALKEIIKISDYLEEIIIKEFVKSEVIKNKEIKIDIDEELAKKYGVDVPKYDNIDKELIKIFKAVKK
ncbi:hypothetical protein [Methanocaldococcus sp.]